jgi:cell division protein FtsL
MKTAAAVAALALVVSPIHAKEKHVPLPASVIAAKTVYIDNQTGHAEITDRAVDALTKWGRFKILKDAKDADLVLRFTADTKGRPTPPHNDIDISPTPVRFSVFDQTNNELWFASKNEPFHSQTRLDIAEFKKRIEEQEKSHDG